MGGRLEHVSENAARDGALAGGHELRASRHRRQVLVLWAVWVVSRLFIVAQVGVWDSVNGANFQDVNYYQATSNHLVETRTMPVPPWWQYPPLAAFLLLVPRLFPDYFVGFILLMLVIDALAVRMLSARSSGLTLAGAWYWVLLVAMMSTFPVLRFDLLTAFTAIAALLLLRRHPFLSGLAIGAGVMLKLWPVVAVLGEWSRRRLATMAGAIAIVAATSFVAAAVLFGDQSGFVTNQAGRGLHFESVAATPWKVREMVTGQVAVLVERNGTNEVASPLADQLAGWLQVATLVAMAAVAAWMIARDRLIRRHGRDDLKDVAVGRDAAFAATLLAMIINGTLSPQFLMWVVGVGAVCMGTRESRMLRPALFVATSVILSFGLYQDPAIMVLRNVLLVLACADAVWACLDNLRADPSRRSTSTVPAPTLA